MTNIKSNFTDDNDYKETEQMEIKLPEGFDNEKMQSGELSRAKIRK